MDAGIPVVTWDADAPKSKRIAYWGVDDRAAGRIMAEEAVRMLGGKGKVALITSLGAVNLQRRLQGVRDVLDKHPGIQVVEVYDIKEDPVRCAEIIASGMNRYPDLAAWISVGGWPVFTRNALDAVNPARTKVISFDTIPPAPDLLKAGKVQVLIGQKYFGWGSESVKLLAGIKAGNMPASQIIDSGVDVVTASNVDDYINQWKRWERGEQ
jgi:ribose transport system substrate-binding protein